MPSSTVHLLGACFLFCGLAACTSVPSTRRPVPREQRVTMALSQEEPEAEHADGEQAEGGHAEGEGEEEHKKNLIGLFLGSTVREDTGVGTIGIKYERRTSRRFGFGAILEKVPDDREEVLLAPALFLHPWRELSLTISPGAEFEEDDTSFLFRVGVGWDFELGNNFSLAPEFNYDMVDGIDNALVVGITLGYAF